MKTTILNLGCGTKISNSVNIVNIDWSIYLKLRSNALARLISPLVIQGERLARFKALPSNILVHNLAKGIPFKEKTIDVVYHSHMLEHLDPDVADGFLLEVLRVLKPGGIHRIVVPDLEISCRDYIDNITECTKDTSMQADHDLFVAQLIEQSVRRESYGTSQQKPLRRFIENLLLGDARRRGETHQWMYDRINLTSKLNRLGYKSTRVEKYDTSQIANWNNLALDLDEEGRQYKPGSLYIEAIK